MNNLATFILKAANNKKVFVFVVVLFLLAGEMPPVGG